MIARRLFLKLAPLAAAFGIGRRAGKSKEHVLSVRARDDPDIARIIALHNMSVLPMTLDDGTAILVTSFGGSSLDTTRVEIDEEEGSIIADPGLPTVRYERAFEGDPLPVGFGPDLPEGFFVELWYANQDGDRWCRVFDEKNNIVEPPEGYIYQHSRFTSQLTENCLRIRDDGSGSDEVFSGNSGFSDDLATAMVRSGHWTHSQATRLASGSCERCMNVLRHHYGLDGYEHGSDEWKRCGTSCELCEPSRID